MHTPHAWRRLEPRTPYVRWLRPALGLVLVLALLPPALLVGLPIAAANLILFRDARLVFFRQERVGHRGRVFRIFKFRTMHAAGPCEEPRVTRLGRLLRDHHLDEIPQLLNVLRGEMSLIGPRPETLPIEEWARARVPGFQDRLVLKPGLTGHAQIVQGSVRDEIEAYRRKLELNLEYLRDMGPHRDIAIVLRTIPLILIGRRRPPATRAAQSAQDPPAGGRAAA